MTFTNVTPTELAGAAESKCFAMGDYDGDGDIDIYVGNQAGTNVLLRNNGPGLAFEDVTPLLLEVPDSTETVSWVDLDEDGDLDLFVGNRGADRLFFNDGTGVFTENTPTVLQDNLWTRAAAWGDYDGDGDLDLYLGQSPSSSGVGANKLIRVDTVVIPGGRQIVGYVDVTATVPALALATSNTEAAAWVDVDGDGDFDLHVGCDGVTDPVFENLGGGVFATHYPLGLARTRGFSWVDFDNDGDLDCFLPNWNITSRLYRNDGGFTFVDVAPAAGVDYGPGGTAWGGLWEDWDNDGDLDLLIQQSNFTDWAYTNNGDGTFTGVLSNVPHGAYSFSVGWADFDEDGTPELYEVMWFTGVGLPNLLVQPEAATGHWLLVKGGTPGTRLWVTSGGVTRMREFGYIDGRGGQKPYGVERFGLGAATTIDRLEIRRPGGARYRLDPSILNVDGVTTLPAIPPLTVTTSKALYEDRVEIAWDNSGAADRFFRIFRDGAPIAVVSAFDDTYSDPGRVPFVDHVYRVDEYSFPDSFLVASGADTGSTVLLAPTSVKASDGTFTEAVLVTWSDRSLIESGFQVWRHETGDSAGTIQMVGTTGPNKGSFIDSTAVAEVPYHYFVVATATVLGQPVTSAPSAEDPGIRAAVLPPLSFAATDGTWSDRVAVSWTGRSGALAPEGYRVYRDGNLLADVAVTGPVVLDTTYTVLDDGSGLPAALGTGHEYTIVSYQDVVSLASYLETGLLETAALVQKQSVALADSGIGGPGTLAPPTKVKASDAAYDGKVVLTWVDAPHETQYVVRRDGAVLDTIPGNTSTFTDVSGVPGIVYSYCLEALAEPAPGAALALWGTSVQVCDDGERAVVAPPSTVSASRGTFEDRVEITWATESTSTALFKIYRDGLPITTVPGNARSFVDRTAPTGVVDYCVVGLDGNGEESIPICFEGYRRIKSPGNVAASDDDYENRVLVTWSDSSAVETGYRIERWAAGMPRPATGTTSQIDLLPTPPATVQTGAFEDDLLLRLFREADDLTLASDVILEDIRSGLSDSVRAIPDTLPAGFTVDSWFIHSDPVTLGGHFYSGTLRFDGEILGIILTKAGLDATDALLGNPGTAYATGENVRGLERSPTTNDFYNVSEDRRTIHFSFRTTAWADQCRILVAPGAELIESGSLVTVVGQIPADRERFEDPTAWSGVRFTYGVVAEDATGESAPGTDIGSRRLVAPTQLTATDGTFESEVRLAWTDNSRYEDGFHVFRSEGGLPPVLIGSTGPNTYGFVDDDPALVFGEEYLYSVAAVDSATGGSLTATDTGFTAVRAPGDVNASEVYDDRVNITWIDRSQVETGYRVFRDGVEVSGSPVGPNVTFLMDSGASGVHEYCVRTITATDVSEDVCDLGGLAAPAPTGTGTIEMDIILAEASGGGYTTQSYGGQVSIGTEVAAVTDAESGSLYIYRRSGTQWLEDQVVTPPSATWGTGTVSVADDDGTIVVGDEGEHRYYIYEPGISGWELTQTLCRPEDSAIGQYLIQVSQGFGGSIVPDDQYVLENATPTFTFTPGGSREVESVALDGVNLPASALRIAGTSTIPTLPYAGAVTYTFPPVTANHTLSAVFNIPGGLSPGAGPVITSADLGGAQVTCSTTRFFGRSAAISGGRLAIYARTANLSPGEVHVYERQAGLWVPQTPGGVTLGGAAFDPDTYPSLPDSASGFEKYDFFGRFLDLDGDLLVVGNEPDDANDITTATVRFYRWDGVSWNLEYRVEGLPANAAGPIAVSGNVVLVGSHSWPGLPDDGVRVYEFDPILGTWGPGSTGPASPDPLLEPVDGASPGGVSIQGGLAAVGYPRAFGDRGAVGIYRRVNGVWTLENVAVDDSDDIAGQSSTQGSDYLGSSVSLGVDFLAAGAPGLLAKSLANGGVVALLPIPSPPINIQASDGNRPDRIQVRWSDRSLSEDGFHVYRDGERIATLPANNVLYDDFETEPGRAHEYVVTAFTEQGIENYLQEPEDYGRRPANGEITGRVTTEAGAPVRDVTVCLEPPAATSLQFDGDEGFGVVETGFVFPEYFTLEFWARPAPDGSNNGTILSKYDIVSGDLVFRVRWLVDGTLRIRVGPGAGNQVDTAVPVLPAGEWRHVAILVDQPIPFKPGTSGVTPTVGAAIGVVVYDPVTGTTHTESLATASNFTDTYDFVPLVVGGELTGNQFQRPFEGQVDDIRVWSTQRTPTQLGSSRLLQLEGNEFGLLHYWPLDHRAGIAAEDLCADPFYLRLLGGTYWVDDAAPMLTCRDTDEDGNYALNRVRYGGGTTFRVVPSKDGIVFDPAARKITLSRESPVWNEVDFEDITQYAITGTVAYRDVETCHPPVELYVDDELAGTTDEKGFFRLAVTPGNHVIEPRLLGHTFTPPRFEFPVGADQDLGLVLDETKRYLGVQVGGGCAAENIGDFTVRVSSADFCYEEEFPGLTGRTEIEVPPGVYEVEVVTVENVAAPYTLGEIITYFDAVGAVEVDLTDDDGEADLLYRAPLQVEIQAVEFDESTCTALILPDGTAAAVPDAVLAKGQVVTLTLEVYEQYPTGRCYPETGTVVVTDRWLTDSQPVELQIENGFGQYRTQAQAPNILQGLVVDGKNRSFQRSLTAVATANNQVATDVKWVVITGHRPRQSTFVATPGGEIPVLVLRDPPGDQSQAWVEQGTSFCTTIEDVTLESTSNGVKVEAKFGSKFDIGLGVENKFEFEGSISGLAMWVESSEEAGQIMICGQTTERISTSSSPLFVGQDGDVYLGVGLNFKFAITDVLDVEDNAGVCRVDLSESVALGPDSFESVHLFTREHLERVQIPVNAYLAEAAREQGDPDRALIHELAVENWQKQIALADKLAGEATFKENRSFSAGADYENVVTTDTTRVSKFDAKFTSKDELAAAIGFEVSGNGAQVTYLRNTELTLSHNRSTQTGSRRAVGYKLSDDDVGDFFSVDVSTDARYGTPVFDLVEGTTSCPWEPGSQKRDQTELLLSGPEAPELVPTGSTAEFTLGIGNLGESEEERPYVLLPVQQSNPKGAVIKVNGQTLGDGGITFYVPALKTVNATLTVDRGPSALRYDDLKLVLIPPCEASLVADGHVPDPAVADTIGFSVWFDGACSEVAIAYPRPDWLQTDNSLTVALVDLVQDVGPDKTLDEVGVEFREVGSDNWRTAGKVNTLPSGATGVDITWDVTNLPDGNYEIRGYTECSGSGSAGRYRSPALRGRIDRAGGDVLSVSPEDGTVLSLGEEISATFTEPIDCTSVDPGVNVTLVNLTAGGDVPVFDVVCSERKIVLQLSNRPALVGDVLQASVSGIEDGVGNPLESSRTWSFQVGTELFAWGAADADTVTMALGDDLSISYPLINGSGELAADFTIRVEDEIGDPAGDVDAVPALGSLAPGQEKSIRFDIDPQMRGTRDFALIANRGLAVADTILLHVIVDCEEPGWVLDPTDYEYTMTLVAKLEIDGVVSADVRDRVAAFVGNEVRGLASVRADQMVYMTIYSNRLDGERIRFRAWDSENLLGFDCHLFDFVATDDPLIVGLPDSTYGDAMFFQNDADLGTNAAPWMLRTLETQPFGYTVVDIDAGWNWISLNRVAPYGLTFDEILADLTPQDGDVLKTAPYGAVTNPIAIYDPVDGWVGGSGFTEFDLARGYLLHSSEAGRIILEGEPAETVNPSFALQTDWNWIGYPAHFAQAVGDALVFASGPAAGDLIKSQTAFARYVGGIWTGDLTGLEPGKGYKLKRAGAPTTLTWNPTLVVVSAFTSGLGDGELVRVRPPERFARLTTLGADLLQASDPDGEWRLDPHGFEYDMTVTAEVRLPDGATVDGETEIAAFVGDEIRGLASPVYLANRGEWVVLLMVFSNHPSGELVTFRVRDPRREGTLEAAQTVSFEPNAIVGRISDPLVLDTDRGAGGPGTTLARLSVSRNPIPVGVNGAMLRFETVGDGNVSLGLYDVQGRRVAAVLDEYLVAGTHEAALSVQGLSGGIYFVRLREASREEMLKIVVVR